RSPGRAPRYEKVRSQAKRQRSTTRGVGAAPRREYRAVPRRAPLSARRLLARFWRNSRPFFPLAFAVGRRLAAPEAAGRSARQMPKRAVDLAAFVEFPLIAEFARHRGVRSHQRVRSHPRWDCRGAERLSVAPRAALAEPSAALSP